MVYGNKHIANILPECNWDNIKKIFKKTDKMKLYDFHNEHKYNAI